MNQRLIKHYFWIMLLFTLLIGFLIGFVISANSSNIGHAGIFRMIGVRNENTENLDSVFKGEVVEVEGTLDDKNLNFPRMLIKKGSG